MRPERQCLGLATTGYESIQNICYSLIENSQNKYVILINLKVIFFVKFIK